MMKYIIKCPWGKNKSKIVLILILTMVVFLSWFFIVKNKTITTPEEVVEVELNFQKEMHLFNKVIKYAWYDMEINNIKGALHRTNEAYTLWEQIDINFKNNQPAEFKQTKDWQSFLFRVDKNLKKSSEYVQENNLSSAMDELKLAMTLLNNARQENDIEYYSKDLLDYYELVKRVSNAPNKAAVQPYLVELKIAYTFLKEKKFEDSLMNIVLAMEKEIGQLDKFLDGPEFKKSQDRLKELFFELYLKY